MQHALNAGDLLLKAKKKVAHGGWLDWLKENCHFSERTAQGYMRLSRELPQLEDSKAQRVADLPLRDALVLLSCGKPKSMINEAVLSDDGILKLFEDFCGELPKILEFDLLLDPKFLKFWGDRQDTLIEKIDSVFDRFNRQMGVDEYGLKAMVECMNFCDKLIPLQTEHNLRFKHWAERVLGKEFRAQEV